MKQTLLILLICISITGSTQGTYSDFSIASIPDSLKKDADAIYRWDESLLEVSSPSKYTEKIHQVITILNGDGAHHLRQDYWFDKFNKIDEIEVKLYNSLGMEVQRFRKKDFNVQSYHDGISLVTDDKLMRLHLPVLQFPCTVEVTYVRTVTSYIDLPDQYLNCNGNSIQNFSYTVKVPSELGIRSRSVNTSLRPVIENNSKYEIYVWTGKNIASRKFETGGYDIRNYIPRIEVAPNSFEYDGYKGNFQNWAQFGQWCYSLYEEKATVSDKRVAEIQTLVNGITDKKEKVAAVYNYLQKNTRYVSIQLGIGGFKPFPAKEVDQNKYGDCKALTNYMRVLLKAIGIKAYPALINAGLSLGAVDASFPANRFNHVILCVPDDKDSIWLECTSRNNKMGFLGSFTENKNALLLTENGGIMVPTPLSDYSSNSLITINTINLDLNGGATVETKLKTSGSFFQLMDEIKMADSDKQKEMIVEYMNYKDGEEFKQKTSTIEQEMYFTTVYSKLFEFKAGVRYFFPLSSYNINSEKMPVYSARNNDYLFQFPYTKRDTSTYLLPKGFDVENIPADKELTNKYFNYRREARFDTTAHSIKIVSQLQLKKHVIDADDYKDVYNMLTEIISDCAQKLILKKNDNGVL